MLANEPLEKRRQINHAAAQTPTSLATSSRWKARGEHPTEEIRRSAQLPSLRRPRSAAANEKKAGGTDKTEALLAIRTEVIACIMRR